MYPVLFQFGTFELRSYGVIVVLSFFLGLWLSAKEAKRKGLDPGLIIGFYLLGKAGPGKESAVKAKR